MEEHLVTDNLFAIDSWILSNGLANQRIGIFAIPFTLQIVCLMVDARAKIVDLIDPCTNPTGQALKQYAEHYGKGH